MSDITGLRPWEAHLLADLAEKDAEQYGASTTEAMSRRALALRLRHVAERLTAVDCRFQRADDDTWLVRGPLDSLQGRSVVTVLTRDRTEVDVFVDPASLTPLPSAQCTRWDGRRPHTVRVLSDDGALDSLEETT